MKKPIFTGACTAIITPFTEQGIDFERLKNQLIFQEDNEIEAIVQRFAVAELLNKKCVYSEIGEKTGASTATISRVNRSLNYGNDGYEMVFSRMKKK